MKGNSKLFGNIGNISLKAEQSLVNGVDYNTAGSSLVGKVNSVTITTEHKMPITGEPNSVIKLYKQGNLFQERYYDENGNPYLDIDYTNHGNPKAHPIVPHQHRIYFVDGKMIRKRADEIIR